MLEPNRSPTFDPLQVSTAFLSSSYTALKTGEATFFALAPLPLQHIKTGIQQVAVPLLVTAAVSRAPGMDQVIGTVIQRGGDLMAAGGKAIASQGLNSFGQAVSSHLPSGFGVRALANGMGQAITPVVLNGVEKSGQFLGEIGTGLLSGRTLINAGQQVAKQIGDKGSKATIGDTVATTQAVIAKTQATLAQVKLQLSNLLKGKTSMAQNTSPNEAREQYVQLLQTYHGDSSLTYEKLGENVSQKPELGPKYDQYVMRQALISEKSPEAVIAAIAQGPHVQNQLNSDKQQNVSTYLAQAHSQYSSQLNNQKQILNNGDKPERSAAQKNGQENKTKQPTQAQVNPQSNDRQLQPDVASILQGSKSEPKLDKSPSQKSFREAEDYALSVVQMLDQRRLNVDRLQIDVNGKTVFKMRDGDINQPKTSITNEQTELIKQALGDPASLKGSVKITQGSQTLLHVKDGRVLIDSVGITKQSAKVEVKTPDSPSEGLYERFSQGVNQNGLQATQAIAANALKAGVKSEEVIDMLKGHDPSYQKLAQAQGEKAGDRMLEKLVDTAEAKLLNERMPQQQQAQEVKASRSVKA